MKVRCCPTSLLKVGDNSYETEVTMCRKSEIRQLRNRQLRNQSCQLRNQGLMFSLYLSLTRTNVLQLYNAGTSICFA